MSRSNEFTRREFVTRFSALSGCFAISAYVAGCKTSPRGDGRRGDSPRYRFPQGIASADPQPDAVLLWARAIDNETQGPVALTLQIAPSAEFSVLVVEETITATASTDFTVRCFVDGLQSNRWYWYRFLTPDGFASRLGRTRTAPDPDEDAALNIAMFSCQNYERGFFNAYRRLIVDDLAAEAGRQIDLCIHVGDFIYENVNGGALPTPASGQKLRHADGSIRTAGNLPSGGEPRGRGDEVLPVTLEDYRYIYKTYLSDPAIQEARARYPFVCIWDDHEVLNDYWQAYHPGGSLQQRKVAGNQAWFEFVPAILSDAQAGPAGPNPAKDFEFVTVSDAPQGEFDADYLSQEPNTRAATDSITIYRSLRWGRLAEILLTDGRSYRGPRGLDSTILGSELIAYPRAPIDPALIWTMNAGRTANNNQAPEFLDYEGETIPNPRRDSPRGAMLGATQKQWLKQTLASSDARWKLICTNVPMMRFGFDTRFKPYGTRSSIFWTDSWDGYPLERQEIMEFIIESNLSNVVSLTGDRHAHFAGFVCDDYEQQRPACVIPELVGASISAEDRFTIQNILFANDAELLQRTRFNGASLGYYTEAAPAMNAWLLFGHESARLLGATADTARALEVAESAINAHVRYADSDAYGFYTLHVTSEQIEAEFVVIPMPIRDESTGTPATRRRVRVAIPAWEPGSEPRMTEIEVAGEPPLLGVKS